jgi:hypothetical protein
MALTEALMGNEREAQERATIALEHSTGRDVQYGAALALALEPTTGALPLSLYPVYVRGYAYLAARRGTEAAAEFKKIVEHPGVVANEPIGALAHLGLGRAYAIQGEVAKSRAAYTDFFARWKGADRGIPRLAEAKAEYSSLR